MIKFTKDTLTIEIKDYTPIEYLFNLQSGILETIQQINWLEMQLETADFQKLTSYSNATFNLLEFFKELRLTSFESNPEKHDFIFNSLQGDIKKEQARQQTEQAMESLEQATKERIQAEIQAKQAKKELEEYRQAFVKPSLSIT